MTSSATSTTSNGPQDHEPLTPTHPTILAFMSQVQADLSQTLPAPKDIFSFGDTNQSVTTSLNRKVILRQKTGTMTFPVPIPRTWDEGDISIGLDANGEPELVMRTTSLVERKFDEIDEDFAASESEGTYEQWRDGHVKFWEGKKDNDGSVFGDGRGKLLLCERFEVLWPAKPDGVR